MPSVIKQEAAEVWLTGRHWWHGSHPDIPRLWRSLFVCVFQRSARLGQASGSRRRPWCWLAATFPPPSCQLPANGWACWRTRPAPWRSWETRGPSTTASKWSSSWAAARLSPTAREKARGGAERHAWTLYIETFLTHTHTNRKDNPTDTTTNTVSGILACSFWTDLLKYTSSYQIVRIVFHGSSLPPPQQHIRRHLLESALLLLRIVTRI